jgi:hypothetical protein
MMEVLSSVAGAELGAFFHNSKEGCPFCTALNKMGHPQNATPMITNNCTTTGISNDTVKQSQSKANDMCFYWVEDCVCQDQFTVIGKEGKRNLADYLTEHLPKLHHTAFCSTYLFHLSNSTRNYFHPLPDNEQEAPNCTCLIGNSSSFFLCVSGKSVLFCHLTWTYLMFIPYQDYQILNQMPDIEINTPS